MPIGPAFLEHQIEQRRRALVQIEAAQQLARHGVHPAIQMLIMADGGIFPSWYHLWQDMEFRHLPQLVTEADLFFPEQHVAVFCDGRHHRRRAQRERDDAINARLRELGITPVRIPGQEIVHDLATAGQKVLRAIG